MQNMTQRPLPTFLRQSPNPVFINGKQVSPRSCKTSTCGDVAAMNPGTPSLRSFPSKFRQRPTVLVEHLDV